MHISIYIMDLPKIVHLQETLACSHGPGSCLAEWTPNWHTLGAPAMAKVAEKWWVDGDFLGNFGEIWRFRGIFRFIFNLGRCWGFFFRFSRVSWETETFGDFLIFES